MRTQGIVVCCGYLVLPWYRSVPPALWARLQHHIARAGLRDEFQREREAGAASPDGLPWLRESALFERWVVKLGLDPRGVWPWSSGWTPELVDSYLTQTQEAA